MTPEQTKRARSVIDALVAKEPRPAHIDSIEAWTKAVTNRLKAERWQDVCAFVEANPDLSIATCAERLSAASAAVGGRKQEPPSPASGLPTFRADPWTPPDPGTRATAKARIAAIRAQLDTTKGQRA